MHPSQQTRPQPYYDLTTTCCFAAKVEAAPSAPAAAQAEDSTGAADAAVRQAQPADPAIGVMPSSAGIKPLAACMEDKRYTGASSPRTGTTDSAPNRHAVTPSSAIPGPSVAPPDVQLSNAAPPRHHRPASAPPAASTSASQAVHWAGPSGSNSNAHASPSQRAQRAPNGQLQHLQPRANGHGELSITPNGHVNDRLSLPNGNSPPSDRPAGLGHNPHEQGNAAPAVVQQQNGHQQADVNGDDDGLEEGEIEEGEVLPDGTVAGATSSAAVNGSMHDGDHNNLTDGSRASMLTNGIRKRSAAPESPDASSLHAAKRRAVQS